MGRLAILVPGWVLVCLAFVPVSTASATQWKEIARSEAGKVSVDTDSLEVDRGNVSYWVYSYAPNDQTNTSGYKFYQTMNCFTSQYQLRRLITFNRQGAVIRDRSLPDQEPRPVLPGSVADRIREFVCTKS